MGQKQSFLHIDGTTMKILSELWPIFERFHQKPLISKSGITRSTLDRDDDSAASCLVRAGMVGLLVTRCTGQLIF